jgi:hypothetical protein
LVEQQPNHNLSWNLQCSFTQSSIYANNRKSETVMARLRELPLVFTFSIDELYSKSYSVLFSEDFAHSRSGKRLKYRFEYVRNHYSRNLKGFVWTFYWEIYTEAAIENCFKQIDEGTQTI